MAYSTEVLADSPYIYWRLGETNFANPADDASPNNRDGTYTGTSDLASVPGALYGDANTAVDFGGATSGGRVRWDVPSNLTGSFTAEIWFNADTTGFFTIVGSDNGSAGQVKGFDINITGGNTVNVQIPASDFASTPKANNQNRTVSYTPGTWYHLALVVDSTARTWKVYLNGVQQGATGTWASGASGVFASDRFLTIGHYGGSSTSFYYNGKLDEFALYTTALSDARILAHYREGRTQTASATGSATGDLSATGTVSKFGALTLTGSGFLSATGTIVIAAEASLTGTGSLEATGDVTTPSQEHEAEAALTGTGSLDAVGFVTRSAEATATGTGDLVADGTVNKFAEAALSGTGSLSATAEVFAPEHFGFALLSGVGSLSATGRITAQRGRAVLTGAGSLSASAVQTFKASAVLVGAGSLTGATTLTENPERVARERTEFVQYKMMMKDLLGR